MLELRVVLIQMDFLKKYNSFFESILVEPIKSEAEKLMGVKNVINKGLWSKKRN